MPDFSKRSEEIEIMDDLDCSGEVVNQTLRELDTINDLLSGNYVTLSGLSQLVKNSGSKIILADLGCGSGDMLRRIRKWATRNKKEIDLVGIDANPNIISFAKTHTPPECNIHYQPIDIFSQEFKSKKFDVVIGTLFFHHFTNEQLIHFFRQLKSQVRIGIVINDIHRHWLAYHSIRILTKLLSKSPMVKYDAPLSVRRAFKKSELRNILDQAGFKNYSLKWMWAFRWQVVLNCDLDD